MGREVCKECGEDEMVGDECHACGWVDVDPESVVTIGVDCCSQAEAGYECDCGKPQEYRGEDRVRGLD